MVFRLLNDIRACAPKTRSKRKRPATAGAESKAVTATAPVARMDTIEQWQTGLPAPASVVAAFTPSSAAVHSKVMRGDHFIGAKALTFNGSSALFTVLNNHFISATVPESATSGPIAITNEGGTTSAPCISPFGKSRPIACPW